MKQFALLKSQKNEVFKLIDEIGFNPSDFKWLDVTSKKMADTIVTKIEYTNSQYYFQFDTLMDHHYAIFSPGRDKHIEEENTGSWEFQKKTMTRWLLYLEREISQSDLWENISSYKPLIDIILANDLSNEPFNNQQITQIVSGLNQTRLYIEEHELATVDQMVIVNEKLDYLINAVQRQGKRDWIYTLIGVFVTIGTALALAPEKAKALWIFIKNAIISGILLLP
jgi:hypothetical protein